MKKINWRTWPIHPFVLLHFLAALLFLHLAWIYPCLLCSILGGLWHTRAVQAQGLSKGRIKTLNAFLMLAGIASWLAFWLVPQIEVAGLFTFSFCFGLLMLNLMQMREREVWIG